MGKTLTIEERIRLHKLWLDNDPNGVRLVEHGDALIGVRLRGVNIRRADLSDACLSLADLRGADLRWARLVGAGLSGANLRWARLDGANLRGANITGCNIDCSAWPLWCGTKGVIVGERIFRQLVDHLLVVVCDTDEAKEAQEWLKGHVGRSHHAEELGLVNGKEE